MIEYFNRFTVNDFVSIYCFGMLGIILMVVSMGLLTVITIHALDLLNVLWYEMKTKKVRYQKIAKNWESKTEFELGTIADLIVNGVENSTLS